VNAVRHEQLPALRQLMGAYLHQDYELFGSNPLAAAETFLRDERRLSRALPGEVEAVLRTHSETEVAALLSLLGCQIPPWANDATYTTSLRELAAAAARMQ
jgi:hypothetical protein